MTSEIPKMPEVEKSEAVGNIVMQMYATALENHARDLATRLEASNALCAELAEALGHMQVCGDCAEDRWEACEGGRMALSALAKFKEATR